MGAKNRGKLPYAWHSTGMITIFIDNPSTNAFWHSTVNPLCKGVRTDQSNIAGLLARNY